MLNDKIFRSYDIRGIYPSQLNEKTAYLIGRAFAKFIRKKSKAKNLKIVVGRDNRLSSVSLFRHLKKGLLQEGAEIIDIGLSSTPRLYWACSHFRFQGGVQITASHNPPEYNGFKLVGKNSTPIGAQNGLKEIKKIALLGLKEKKGDLGKKIVKKKTTLSSYINFNLKLAGLKEKKSLEKLKGVKIVFDTANGVAGIEIKELIKKIPSRSWHLFAELLGSFPNHGPDPLQKENLKILKEKIKAKKADLGVAFDGDGDRIIFLDEKGNTAPGDFITALVSKIILEKKPGQKILYDIRSSNIVPETIKKYKGLPLSSKIGHTFIKNKMQSENIAFAGEFSGHYYLREHYFCEAPLFVLLTVLKELAQKKKPFSQIMKEFSLYQRTEEINFKAKNKEKILKELGKKFRGGKASRLDGLRVDFPDWWFIARPSGTEDLLRLCIEAKTKKILLQKKKEIITLIKKLA